MIDIHEQVSAPPAPPAADVQPRLDAEAARALGADLAILGHPVRLQILDILAQSDGHVCVCDIEHAVPVKQPTVSHHLKLLREAGVINCVRRGQWAYYFIRPETMGALRGRVAAWLDSLV